MRLAFLELENIRTYPKVHVNFQPGVTLFEGDVGCGKSTLLYAIEFALFGLGDLKAGHLLRHGESTGTVKLGVEVQGRNIVVFRQLERKKDAARQAPGWIEEDGVRTEYTAEELKKRILTLLGFRENPSAKATSWIFRYAVFTPQEEMKEILALRPEERLQTLRKAFGVEEYRLAKEHAVVVQQHLRETARELKGRISDVPALESKKKDLQEKERLQEAEKARLQADVEKKNAECKSAEDLWNRCRETAATIEREAAEVPKHQKRAEDLRRQKERLEADERNLRTTQARLLAEEQGLQAKLQTILADPSGDWEKAENGCRELQKQLGAAEHAAREHQLLKSGTCPTCGQRISDGLSGKIRLAEDALKGVQEKMGQAQALERALREKVREFNEQKLTLQKIGQVRDLSAETKARLDDAGAKNSELANALAAAVLAFEQKKHHLHQLAQVRESLKKTEMAFRQAQEIHNAARMAVGQSDAQMKLLQKQLDETEKSLSEKKAYADTLTGIEEKNRWVSEHFIPSLSTIEEHVLYHINHEFNRLFSRWFVNLLETQDLEAEVDPSFTPCLRQQGFEQDYTALSGGEKSALALSYRLALNTVVRQTTPSLSHNLLILDEPTDGFSKEQLSRMRSVLSEAGAQQILLVSHERELEAFCDQVYSVQKSQGVSSVKAL